MRNAYPILAEEEMPLMVEQDLKFVFDGRAFNLQIDAIRKDENGNIIIRGFKSGRYAPDPEHAELQFKLYGLAFCTCCHFDEEFYPNQENRELYDNLFEEFKNLYKQNKKWFKRVNSG